MKLRKQNDNGSLSVILPKSILDKLHWKAGQEIDVSQYGIDIRLINVDLQPPQASGDTLLAATQSWCNLTNALIRKYKTMAETNPEQAIKELQIISNYLVSAGCLSETDLRG